MKQKQILSLLGLVLLVLGVSAGTLLVQQNQEIREKATTCGTTCTQGELNKCGPTTNCQAGKKCKSVTGCNTFVCQTDSSCTTTTCNTGDCYKDCICKGHGSEACKIACPSPSPNSCAQKGFICRDQCKIDETELSYACSPSAFVCCRKTGATPKPTGGGTPPPGQKTPKPPGKKKTPAPSCQGNKNPSTFTVIKDGKITIYYNVQGTGETPLQVAVKPNATTCSLTDNAGVFDLTDNATGKMETNLEVTSGQKVCFGIYYNNQSGAMWKAPNGNICGGGDFDELDISANVTQAESESGTGSISSKQCWANSLTECDFNDFALIFAVGTGGTDNTVGIKLRFQGITKKAWDQKIKANFSKSGSTTWEKVDLNVSNDETGVYTLPVDPAVSPGTYDLRIKGHSHLQKLFSNLVYNGTGADLSTSQANEIRAGDVTDDNAITIEDVAQVSSYYTDFSIPVVEGDAKMVASDINKDGIITIQDLALIAINWSDLRVEGDK